MYDLIIKTKELKVITQTYAKRYINTSICHLADKEQFMHMSNLIAVKIMVKLSL